MRLIIARWITTSDRCGCIHLEDGGRVRNRKICEIDGDVPRDYQIGRGYEISKGQIVEVTDQDLDGVPLPTAKAIDIVAFVDRDSIDPVRIGQSYYLEADGPVAAKPYTLLRRALERSEKVAIAKFALRGRERLRPLSFKEAALVLHSMHWPDGIRSPAELKSGGGQVVDLMAALEQSVQTARESRGESGDTTVHEMPQKKTAKKSPAKKTATKKKASGGRKLRSA